MVRGRPPAHTRDQVVDAAIAVADTDGLAAVTMRRIATEIGAGAMSLYTYVPDKDRLVDLMVDRVGGTADPVTLTGDWQADVLALAGAQRALMLAHPWLPGALPNRRLTGRNSLAYLEQGLTALAPTGLAGATRLELIAVVTGFVASFVTNELAGGAPRDEQLAELGRAVASGDFPQLAALIAAGGAADGPAGGAPGGSVGGAADGSVGGAAGGAAGGSVGGSARLEPSFERLATWMITGLVDQARKAA